MATPITIRVDPLHGTDRPGLRPDGDGYEVLPYATISAAIEAARSGDVIRVLSGTYAERLTLKNGVTLVADGIVTVQITDNSTGDLVSAGGVANTSAKMLGPWKLRRTGAPASGHNSLVTATESGSDLYVEFIEAYNGCTTTNETQCFETGNGGKLRARQIGPGLCQSLSYDLFVDYGADDAETRSFFELQAWDLVEAGQSIVEMSGSFNSADVRIRARKAISGAVEPFTSILLLDPSSEPDILLEFAEYMYAPVGPIVNSNNESGTIEVRTPLMYALTDKPIVAGVTKLIVRDADIVAVASDTTTVENVAGTLQFYNCRFFPTGTGKPIDTGTVECYNCYTKIANSGPTIVGTLTTATGMAAPSAPTA